MKTFIVCGLHRSGTTFVGKLLQQTGVVVVHEPLNERFGFQNVPIAYPYVSDEELAYHCLIDDAVHFKRAWNTDVSFIQSKGLRRKFYQLTGGKSGLRWAGLRARHLFGVMPSQVCLKDPFMSLATPYLVKKHQVKIVCMVRHPAAIHYSTAKQGWHFDIQNLRQQEKLVETFVSDVSDEQWQMAEEHAAASIAILWKVMLRVNQQSAQESSCLKMIKHEDLCLYPLETAKKVCSHFGVNFTESLESFVLTHSQGAKTEAESGKVHDFKRNSKALVDSWRGHLSSFDEQLMKDIVGVDVEDFYGCW